MAETMVLTGRSYEKLVKDLRAILAEGKQRAETAVKRQLVETYWLLGKRITEEKLTSNAGYGDSIVADLAEDLGIKEQTLHLCVSFFGTYKKVNPRVENLTWSHYRALIGVKDPEARKFYEEEASRNGWKRDELVSAIRRGAFEEAASGGTRRKVSLKRPDEPFYIYKGVVERVIDGDTLICRFDLGFLVWRRQRIRLAEIDCPEIDTEEGRRAFHFTRREMARVEWVVVKTRKVDIYGRYVGHLFYSTTETDKVKIFEKGKYLSEELLKRGLARRI